MGKINSRAKGANGERELSGKLKEYGYNTRRGQQYCGANGDADVVGLPGIHIECKRVERLNLYDAMMQARNDARYDEKPAVFHRKNYCEWLVTMRLADWLELYREWDAGNLPFTEKDR
jgi:Holliday junction resolvase